ncbi:MAG: SRPBCC family protein [Anaerolineae bacterium]
MLVSNEIVIARPLAAVFDTATTAKYWPEWHPATLSVAGQIDRPARLGDVIIERVQLGPRAGEGAWTVVEDDHPHRLVLKTSVALGEMSITYTADATPDGTVFRRDLEYPDLGPPMEELMRTQSAVGMENLKALLERLIPA